MAFKYVQRRCDFPGCPCLVCQRDKPTLKTYVWRQVIHNAISFSQKGRMHLQGLSAGEIARKLKISTQSVMPCIEQLLKSNCIEIKPGGYKNIHAYLQTFAKFTL